ncbi:tryptophan-rich sensory protein [bacterium]|nr:tryptophan-rich sensory protein [bacterium]
MLYNSDWYNSLIKPVFAPPNWLFAPVWTALYILIAVSLIIFLFKKTDKSKNRGYLYFALQLILNLLWTPVFFGLQNIPLALIVLLFLNIFIFLTIKQFYSISKISSLLLIPYFLWTIFAMCLNIGYLVLN